MLTNRSLKNLALSGGISALVNAFAYIVGIGLVFTYLSPIMEAEAEEYVKFIVEHQTLMLVWHLLIYLVAGVTMVPLALINNTWLLMVNPMPRVRYYFISKSAVVQFPLSSTSRPVRPVRRRTAPASDRVSRPALRDCALPTNSGRARS